MTKIILPNVRKVFVPDPGYTLWEADLRGADAQVVAWEAEDHDLMDAFKSGLDVHSKNAEDMWGTAFTQLQGASRDRKRQQNKVAVHLTNYGGTARTLAITQGWTIHEAERFQHRWFALHPGVASRFHARVRESLARNRTVYNPYGFRRIFFDRIDQCFGEALAWIPQSTVAITTYLGAFELERRQPEAQLLLQVHDSLVFQTKTNGAGRAAEVQALVDALTVTTPYPEPLKIPWELKCSDKSWGDCQKP